MSTELPGATDVPALGARGDDHVWRVRSATAWLVTLPTLRPAWLRAALLAWFWVRPISEGTGTLAGPDETVRVTELPWVTLVPGERVGADAPCPWTDVLVR